MEGRFNWEHGQKASFSGKDGMDDQGDEDLGEERRRLADAKRYRITQSIRRGLLRFCIVAIDCSEASLELDFKGSRCVKSLEMSKKFAACYFDQNPISQMGTIAIRNGIAERISDLSGLERVHEETLQRAIYDIKEKRPGKEASGAASLANTLKLALDELKDVPNYGFKEVLIVFSSLSSCDPDDIFEALNEVKAKKVRVSVISLAAEIYICKRIAEATGGSFHVAKDPAHLHQLMTNYCVPPPELGNFSSKTTEFIRVGFPKRTFDHPKILVSGASGGKQKIEFSGYSYKCPRCFSRVLECGSNCLICGLLLQNSAKIARSHHFLSPIADFDEVTVNDNSKNSINSNSNDNSNSNYNSNSSSGSISINDINDISSNNNSNSNSSSGVDTSTAMALESASQVKIDGGRLTLKLKRTIDQSVESKPSLTLSLKHTPPPPPDPLCAGCFIRMPLAMSKGSGTSSSSASSSSSSTVGRHLSLRCPGCMAVFCIDCDLFIHDSLHNCPSCRTDFVRK